MAWLFDGLTDQMENQVENMSVGGLNQTIVRDYEESDRKWDRVWHVRHNQMDCMWLSIFISVWNALWDKLNKNLTQSIGQ